MRSLRGIAFASLVCLAIGCGDDGAPPPPPDEDGGEPTDAGGTDAGPGDGGSDDGGVEMCTDPDGPDVEIVAPAPASDPNEDTVLVADDRIQVRCTAVAPGTPGSRPVDNESVGIVRLNEDGSVADSPPVTLADGDFVASFGVSMLDNGPITFRCTAQDTAEEPRCGVAEVTTLLDRGPRLEILQPPDGAIRSSGMTVRYRVEPAPLTDADTEAGIASHELVIAGATIDGVTETDGVYEVSVDFSDTSVFDETLVGEYELVVRATNMRTPDPATRQVVQSFTVDSSGPTIEFVEPDVGAIVGGRVRVAANLTDPAGVDDTTAILRIRTDDVMMIPMMRVDPDGDEFDVHFDASVYDNTVTELTLNITAADTVGNENTASRVVKLDSVPPIASLDPPAVREGDDSSDMLECSALFDPVGDDSVEDGTVAGTAAEFRARVQELGNSSFGGSGTVTFLAGMEDGSVQLYLLDDTSRPLLVDSDSDGVCDAINPDVVPGSGVPDTAAVVDLLPVTPTGSAFFDETIEPTTPGTPESAYGSVFDACNAGTDTMEPGELCPESSPLSRVIPASLSGNPPAIWAKEPIEATTCVGDAFDFQGVLSEGWACVAVRAEDGLGNVGVSAPMRTCFTDGMDTNPCPGEVNTIAPEADRPECTDGCTLPPSFEDYPALQLVIPD